MTAAHRVGEGMFMEKDHYTECGLDNIYLINGFEAREYLVKQTKPVLNGRKAIVFQTRGRTC